MTLLDLINRGSEEPKVEQAWNKGGTSTLKQVEQTTRKETVTCSRTDCHICPYEPEKPVECTYTTTFYGNGDMRFTA